MSATAHHPDLDEQCGMCPAELRNRVARHKVAEVISTDWSAFAREMLTANREDIEAKVLGELDAPRHELTAFLCCGHFAMVMGPLAAQMCEAGR